ncbi:hypothetical protein CKJ55_24620 [Mycobacterium avium]|nr:hypothetical protein CKJ55_24620 [Mycobacterium avium]PBA81529.1 hypothetical protein CKJ71_24885 [Mycobacterium avium]
MHYNFPGINDGLDSLDTMNSTASSKQEELETELANWMSFWDGDALVAATQWSKKVSADLEHAIQAARNYVATGRSAVADMQAQEATNTAMWA